MKAFTRRGRIRATQFFEFAGGIAQSATEGETVRLPHTLFQPIATQDVAAALTGIALAPPVKGMVEVAGPETVALDDFIARYLQAKRDPRKVITDAGARYFGIVVDDRSRTPGKAARLGPTNFETWPGTAS